MIDELQQLSSIREAQLDALQSLLARRLAALAEVDAELSAIDAELAQIAAQRAIWEQQWQHWLQKDQVLQHGQDYNLAHVALSAWETEAKQARIEIAERRRVASDEAQTARAAVMKARMRVDALADMLREARRSHRVRHAALLDSRAQDELISRAGALRLAALANKEVA